MCQSCRIFFTLIAAVFFMVPAVSAQGNPYRVEEGWAKFADGRKWGSTSAVDVDRDGAISGLLRDAVIAAVPDRHGKITRRHSVAGR